MKENVVIGNDDIGLHHLFAHNIEDWITNEYDKTLFTEERYLPKILVELHIAKSTSEVRKNRPDLNITLDDRNFITIKWGKKFVWIAVFPKGE